VLRLRQQRRRPDHHVHLVLHHHAQHQRRLRARHLPQHQLPERQPAVHSQRQP
jgi:hypothetical protein